MEEALHFLEPSLVRLAINALQGAESALITIRKLSPMLLFSSADRTSRHISNCWTRSSSTVALGNLLNSMGQYGCIMFLLRRLVNYFGGIIDTEKHTETASFIEGNCTLHNLSSINQAFAISVGKIVQGYISALNTLSASVSLRRLSKTSVEACLTAVGNSEITLLEVYLHTAGLRSQIEALGNVCKVNNLILGFPVSSLEELRSKAQLEFTTFPRNAALISFLYAQLKIADPENCALLKFLFLQSYAPYSCLIRSWIFEGTTSGLYDEFLVQSITMDSMHASANGEAASCSPLPSNRIIDSADMKVYSAVPCFLEECVVPLVRTGHQLQVIIKFLELSNVVGTCDIQEEILPCLSALSIKYEWFAVPLTFDKGCIEEMVGMRASYYEQMLEKIESITDKFDFISQKDVQQSVSLRFLNSIEEGIYCGSFCTANRSLILPEEVKITSCTALDYEISSIVDGHSFDEDNVNSSECSSTETFEDSNDYEKMTFKSHGVEPSYLSSLVLPLIPYENLVKNLYKVDGLYSTDNDSSNLLKFRLPENPIQYETCFATEHKLLLSPVSCDASRKQDIFFFDDYNTTLVKLKEKPDNRMSRSLKSSSLLDSVLNSPVKASKASGLYEDYNGSYANLDMIASQVFDWKYDSAFFTSTPALIRGPFFSPHEKGCANYIGSYVDFSSITDPAKAFLAKYEGDNLPKDAFFPLVMNEVPASFTDTRNQPEIKNHSHVIIDNNIKLFSVTSLVVENDSLERYAVLQSISGGSSWESLLDRSECIVQSTVRDHRVKLVAGADLPLDFVIKRSLLDEIVLQYKYISKLAIKLLMDVFKLQEHFQALRCYHFMELADWADLFIISLQHYKWHDTEDDKRISEIQRVLELAIQRSSCERDPHKDRLYVYPKGNHIGHLSASARGINAFSFLGLGYRIDWPVSMILTPAALRIYSDIFNFLMQVKLAVSSLSSLWLSLKFYCSEQRKADMHQMTLLTETRHMVFHFLSTLQQYVRVQLSQVSWYNFQHSIKCKVKDIYDLESEHMAYLTESLYICFLSEDTRHIAAAIENIVQCAMEYHSFLTGRMLESVIDERISQVDIMQVYSIRRRFLQNLEELYLITVKSPKQGGIWYLWDLLNYNEYYAGIMSRQVGNLMFRH